MKREPYNASVAPFYKYKVGPELGCPSNTALRIWSKRLLRWLGRYTVMTGKKWSRNFDADTGTLIFGTPKSPKIA